MATLSHEGFRLTAETFGGCDEYFTEMINASSLLNNGPWEKFYVINEVCPEKMVWQLTGNDAGKISGAAEVVCRKEGIGVDLNMGCSAPQIYKTGAGISWMTKPAEETAALVSSVRKVLDCHEKETGRHMRLSVKCRLGDENFTEKSFLDFCELLIKNGAELITVHARTKKEKYRGLPRYSLVQKAASAFPETAFYVNGCIKDTASALYAMEQCPSAKGLMIAREAAVKPWIFRELKDSLASHFSGQAYEKNHQADRLQVLLDFIDSTLKYQPQEFIRTRLQRFFAYYCRQFFFGHDFACQMVNNASSPEDCKKIARGYFQRNPREQIITF